MTNPDAVFQRFSLDDRKTLITRSSHGIRWETVQVLAEAGATVYLDGRDGNCGIRPA